MSNSQLGADFKSYHELIQHFGQEVVDNAMRNLGVERRVRGKKRRAVATGTLRKSLRYQYNPQLGTLQFYAAGTANDYADFVEQGVNGTAVNQGSPYSFKSKYANIGAIKEWMKVKRIMARDKDGKVLPQTEQRKNALAFVIARSVAKKGIAPLHYWADAYDNQLEQFNDAILEALVQDINFVINHRKKTK